MCLQCVWCVTKWYMLHLAAPAGSYGCSLLKAQVYTACFLDGKEQAKLHGLRE